MSLWNYPHYLVELLRAVFVCAVIGAAVGLVAYFAVTRHQ